MFTIPLLKSLHARSFSSPNSNFTTLSSGAGGAHPHQQPRFLLLTLPFHGPHCSWNSWPFPVL